jgi:hypothetical protein
LMADATISRSIVHMHRSKKGERNWLPLHA